ncbi:MAG: hypothetical protein SFT91_02835 [Rickettsiaceae bacterium]|nr:hypothetical protein [Rickettsiaceae bacterium]
MTGEETGIISVTEEQRTLQELQLQNKLLRDILLILTNQRDYGNLNSMDAKQLNIENESFSNQLRQDPRRRNHNNKEGGPYNKDNDKILAKTINQHFSQETQLNNDNVGANTTDQSYNDGPKLKEDSYLTRQAERLLLMAVVATVIVGIFVVTGPIGWVIAGVGFVGYVIGKVIQKASELQHRREAERTLEYEGILKSSGKPLPKGINHEAFRKFENQFEDWKRNLGIKKGAKNDYIDRCIYNEFLKRKIIENISPELLDDKNPDQILKVLRKANRNTRGKETKIYDPSSWYFLSRTREEALEDRKFQFDAQDRLKNKINPQTANSHTQLKRSRSPNGRGGP